MNNKPITETVGNKAIVLDHDTFHKMLDRPTLRDQFAMAALAVYINHFGATGIHAPTDEHLARWSYDLADAMLKEREDSDE